MGVLDEIKAILSLAYLFNTGSDWFSLHNQFGLRSDGIRMVG